MRYFVVFAVLYSGIANAMECKLTETQENYKFFFCSASDFGAKKLCVKNAETGEVVCTNWVYHV